MRLVCRKVSQSDFKRIEKSIAQVSDTNSYSIQRLMYVHMQVRKENQPFQRLVLTRDEALDMFKVFCCFSALSTAVADEFQCSSTSSSKRLFPAKSSLEKRARRIDAVLSSIFASRTSTGVFLVFGNVIDIRCTAGDLTCQARAKSRPWQ